MPLLNTLYAISWQAKAFLVACGFVPFIIGVPFITRAGLHSNLVLAGWGIGYVIFLGYSQPAIRLLSGVRELSLFAITIAAGFIIGGPLNAMIGQALNEAPNPGLPYAITGTGPAMASVTLVVLAALVPAYFPDNHFSWVNFTGIILIALGVGMVMYSPQ